MPAMISDPEGTSLPHMTVVEGWRMGMNVDITVFLLHKRGHQMAVYFVRYDKRRTGASRALLSGERSKRRGVHALLQLASGNAFISDH